MSRKSLCAGCAHTKVIETSTGSRFWMCRLSKTDPAYGKYPAQPVLDCAGFQTADDTPR